MSWRRALTAALILPSPSIAGALSGRFFNSNNETLALALCPVVIAVFASATGVAENADLTGLLWPGLAGVAGLMLLVPEPAFGTVRPWLGLFAIPVLVGAAASVWARRGHRRGPSGGNSCFNMAAGLACSAGMFGILSAVHWRVGGASSLSFSAATLDGMTAGLTLLALGRMGAVRWSAQFLFTPLVALLEGVIFLKPVLDWRSYVAFGLLGISTLYQGTAKPEKGNTGVPQRVVPRVPET